MVNAATAVDRNSTAVIGVLELTVATMHCMQVPALMLDQLDDLTYLQRQVFPSESFGLSTESPRAPTDTL